MKALLINPAERLVSAVEYSGDFQEIYKLLSCETFDAPVIFANNDTLYCDDEGLFKPKMVGGFKMKGWGSPIVGKCLVVGCDDEGCDTEVKSSIEEITEMISEWLSAEEAEVYRRSPQANTFIITSF